MGQVRPLIGRADAEKLADIIIRDNLSARDIEALIKYQLRTNQAESRPKQKSADTKALEVRAYKELGLSMRLDWDERKDRGQVVVKLTSLEQLDDLLAKIGLIQTK